MEMPWIYAKYRGEANRNVKSVKKMAINSEFALIIYITEISFRYRLRFLDLDFRFEYIRDL